MPPLTSSTPHRIVIVGGGAGGLPLAAKLGNRYGRRQRVHVTLVDQFATHIWKPLLHEVAAGRMDADAHDLDYLAIAHWHHFRFMQGAVAGLERAKRELKLAAVLDDEGAPMLPERVIAYDTLIICVGSQSNDFGVPGVAKYAAVLDTLRDAERFHRRLLSVCVRADARGAVGESTAVPIVIIGAGATGVELAAEIRHTTLAHAAYGLPHLNPKSDIRITLVEAHTRILPPLSDHVANAATQLLADLDVEVRTGERVMEVSAEGVTAKAVDPPANPPGGAVASEAASVVADAAPRNPITFFPADLVVWAAGIKAPAWLASLDGLEVNRANQLVVNATLATTRDPNIFALGDCAAAPWLGTGKNTKDGKDLLVPPRAQVAHQQATLLLRSIKARLDGKPLPDFHFRDFGSLVSLGEISAVGNLMGRLIGGSILIEGLIARWMYASLYKMHQVSIHGYIAVALDTLGRLLRGRVEPRVKLH
jgi:NADH dehydrogenase